MTLLQEPRRLRAQSVRTLEPRRFSMGVGCVLASEAFSSAVGFFVLVTQARRLGPDSFARVEYASAAAAWMLVLVRGGVDVIVYREAARRPLLIAPLTNHLIALRLVAACMGYAVICTLAVVVGPDRGMGLLVAGLLLFVSAWTLDVGPRAEGRLGWISVAIGARATGLLALVAVLVKRPSDTHRAMICLVLAEGLSVAVSFVPHLRKWGLPSARLSRRTSLVLATRGLIAGLARFGRVTLYGADLLVLGSWGSSELGAFAAGRRVIYALLALGLVVPSVLGPTLARAWVHGAAPARLLVGKSLGALIAAAVPASLGLVLVADRAMPALFGGGYAHEGSRLALHVARLPWLLAGSFIQSALVAFGKERWTLRLVLSSVGLAAIVYPVSLAVAGAWGVGFAAMLVEVVSAIGGWLMLVRLGVAPGRELRLGRTLAASLGLAVACRFTRSGPLVVECVAGAIAYISVWFLVPSARPFDGAST